MTFSAHEAVPLLARTPALLNSWLRHLPACWIEQNEGPSTWSAFDIVGHLIHGERTDWIPRAELILGETADKHFVPFDRFAQFEASKGRTLPQLLDTFAQLRAQNIERLQQFELSEAEMAKTGIHPEFGEVTLGQLLATWVAHDMSHIAQLARVMAHQYKDAAGPWKAYLGILQ